METSTADHILENCTINAVKNLDINKRVNLTSDKVQFFYFPKNKSFYARKILTNLKIENFPNVFVFLIDFDEEIDEILKLIAVKFTNRPLLVQVKSENSLNFYIKRENEFKRVESVSNYDENVKFTAENLLSKLKTSITEANFSQFTAHVDGGFIKHCHVYDSGDDFCFRLLNLYEDNFNVEMQCDILLSVIKNDNFKFFLAFFNVFELKQIYEPQSEILKSDLSKKLLEILKHLIERKDIEHFKTTIKFLSSFRLCAYDHSSLFRQIVDFVVQNNFYKFHKVLKNVKICYQEGKEFNVLHFAGESGFIDLFSNILKSKHYVEMPNFFTLAKLLSFYEKEKDLKEIKRVELMVQEFLIKMLGNDSMSRALIQNDYTMKTVMSLGFEINLKFFYAKMIELFTLSEVRKILSKNNLLIMTAKWNLDVNSVKFVWKIMEKFFYEDEMLKFATEKRKKLSLLNAIAKYGKSEEICEFVWLKIKSLVEDNEKLRDLLLRNDFENQNPLIHSACCDNENSFKFLLEKVYFELFEPKEFIYETNFCDLNFYHNLLICSTALVEFATNLLKSRLTNDEFKDFITLKGHMGKNILYFATSKEKHENLIFLANFIESELGIEELRRMLSEGDDEDYLPLYCVIKYNKNPQILQIVISIYEEKFSFHELQEILSMKKLISIHNLYQIGWFDPLIAEIFEMFLKRYFDPMISYYLDLKNLMISESFSCDDLNKFWVKIEKKNDILDYLFFEINFFNKFECFVESNPKFEFFCHKTVELFNDKEKLKEILLAKNSNGSNALKSSFKRFDDIHELKNFFPFLFEKIYCKHLDFEDFIYEKDSQGNVFLQDFVKCRYLLVIKLLMEQCKAKLSKEKFKEILRFRNNVKQNLLHITANICSIFSIERLLFVKEIFESELNPQEIKEMLMESDENGQLSLHSIASESKGDVKIILSFYVENFSEDEVNAMIRRERNGKMILDPKTVEHFCNIATTLRYQIYGTDEFDIHMLFE